MKKIIFSLILCLFIVGCGKDYETYTEVEKRKMYNLALDEQEKGNNEKIEEINKLIEKLEIAYKKGDETAKIEFYEWHETKIGTHRSYTDKLKNSKVDMTNRAW